MIRKTATIIITAIILVCAFSLVGCGAKHYDVQKNDIAEYLWENCFCETLDGKLLSANLAYYDGYLWFHCYLPTDMTFEQVEPLLKEMKQKVINFCSDKSFKPRNTILFDEHYTVYVELVNKREILPSNYPRTAGMLTIRLGEFPTNDAEGQEAVFYY